MKRRCDAAPAETGQADKPEPEKQHYSVRPYIIIMFIAVILLIALSYLIQQRRNSATIDNLTESHSQFSIEALQNIETLQESNLALTDQVDELERENEDLQESVDQLELQLKAAEAAGEQTRTELETALQKYQALSALWSLQAAVAGKDMEAARQAAAQLESLKDYLEAAQLESYEAMVEKIDIE